MKFYRLCVRNPASGLLQIVRKLENWQWRHNLVVNFFRCCFVSLVNFSYYTKFHVNITTGSGVMTISFYKRLTRIPEIGNTAVWVLPIIWRRGRVRNFKSGKNVYNKIYWMLQNSRVTVFTISGLLRVTPHGRGGGKITLPRPRLELPKI